jgi:hypothetical protein
MSKFPLFCITILLLTAGSVFSQDVHYNFDNMAGFSKFKTYKWVTLKSEAPIDKLIDEQIRATLDTALAPKSLTKVGSDSTVDLFIGYQTTEHIDEKFAELGPGWSVGPGWFPGGWYGPTGGTTVGKNSLICRGELAVDKYDPANQHLIWRSVASKTLDPKALPDKRQKNLNKAVAKLMKNYPPPATK